MPAMNDGLKLALTIAVLFPLAWFGLQAIGIILGFIMLAGIVEVIVKLSVEAWRAWRTSR
jgi:hypothetical protein